MMPYEYWVGVFVTRTASVMLMKFRSYRVLGGPCHRLFLCSSCLLRFLLLVRSNIFDYCIDSRSVTSGEAPYGWILMWQSNHKTKKVQFPNINLELWYEEKIVKNIIVGIVKNSFQCFSIKSFFFLYLEFEILLNTKSCLTCRFIHLLVLSINLENKLKRVKKWYLIHQTLVVSTNSNQFVCPISLEPQGATPDWS